MIIALVLFGILLLPLVIVRAALEVLIALFPSRSWMRVLAFSIGPKVPLDGARRETVLWVSGAWLRAAILLLGVGWLCWYLPRFLGDHQLSTLELDVGLQAGMLLSSYAGVLCLLECIWALARIRTTSGGRQSEETHGGEQSVPPSYSTNPSPGGERPPLTRAGCSPAAGYAGPQPYEPRSC